MPPKQKPVGRHHHGDLRRALLDAVAEITQRAGPEAVKLRELARRIGVSHAALTPHFGDLRGLLTAFASEAFERLTQSMESEIAGAPNAPLRASGRGYIRFAMTNPGHFRTMFRTDHLDMSNPGLARAGEAAFGVLRRAMCAEYPELDGEALADRLALAWSAVHGYAMLRVEGGAGDELWRADDRVAAAEPMLELLSAALAPGSAK
jgi:AcrR family transcriptional regulator